MTRLMMMMVMAIQVHGKSVSPCDACQCQRCSRTQLGFSDFSWPMPFLKPASLSAQHPYTSTLSFWGLSVRILAINPKSYGPAQGMVVYESGVSSPRP